MAQAIGEKRGAQVGLIFGKLLPKGRTRESFAGKKAHPLDAARIAELRKFVETSMKLTGVPGVSLGLYQDGKVVLAEGFGVRELGKPAKVDADTTLHDRVEHEGDDDADARQARRREEAHLGHAGGEGPAVVQARRRRHHEQGADQAPHLRVHRHAAPGPRVAARVRRRHARQGDGRARDDAADEQVRRAVPVLEPDGRGRRLHRRPRRVPGARARRGVRQGDADAGVRSARHDGDDARLRQGARTATPRQPHAPDIDGKPALAEARANLSIVPVRPAGGAWSTVNDMLKYVAMELAEGKLPDGKRYISKEALLARRAPQVAIGTDVTYGMGLIVEHAVRHARRPPRRRHDRVPQRHDVAAGARRRRGDPDQRRSRLADAHRCSAASCSRCCSTATPEADGQIAAAAKTFFDELAAERKLLTVPADAAEAGKLAATYANPALGEIVVSKKGAATIFDFGEWSSEVASRKNPDGTISFITIVPGFSGLEFVVGDNTLTLRDAQHEYVLRSQR